MPGGAEWEQEIEQKLRECDIFVLLVSRHSLASDYVVDKEIPIIHERRAKGEDVYFYPLLLTPTPKIGLDLVRGKNLRPREGRPFSDYSLNERYRHMSEAADEIAEIAGEVVRRGIQSSGTSHPPMGGGQPSPVAPPAVSSMPPGLGAPRDQLRSRAEETSASGSPLLRAPVVFLSYASEDVEAVDELARKLESRGVKVWRDKQTLRAGDRWNEVLHIIVKKQVDYVIVIQTYAMISAVSGVFHREIQAAQEMQADMGEFEGQRLRFLIPVTIGPLEPLRSLRDFHAIDVSDPEGVNLLVESIREDWEKREKIIDFLQPQ